MIRDVFVRGDDNITELEYYAKIARIAPSIDYSPCAECGGCGYLRYHRPIVSSFFGQLKPCQTCSKPSAGEAEDEKWWVK